MRQGGSDWRKFQRRAPHGTNGAHIGEHSPSLGPYEDSGGLLVTSNSLSAPISGTSGSFYCSVPVAPLLLLTAVKHVGEDLSQLQGKWQHRETPVKWNLVTASGPSARMEAYCPSAFCSSSW